mgnify:CR=1 FL=1
MPFVVISRPCLHPARFFQIDLAGGKIGDQRQDRGKEEPACDHRAKAQTAIRHRLRQEIAEAGAQRAGRTQAIQKPVTGPMPERPLTMPSQLVAMSLPKPWAGNGLSVHKPDFPSAVC